MVSLRNLDKNQCARMGFLQESYYIFEVGKKQKQLAKRNFNSTSKNYLEVFK